MSLSPSSIEANLRPWLAIIIVGLGIFAVTILASIAISKGDETSARDILTLTLPVIGTWIGTVIAFYFAKDNLVAAASVTKELLTSEQRLKSIKVRDAMIPISQIDNIKEVKNESGFLGLNIVNLLNDMTRNRALIVNENQHAIALIHKSLLTEFISSLVGTNATDVQTKTMQQMKEDKPTLFTKCKAFAFVSENATLAETKAAMQNQSKDCSDVFITANGSPNKPIIGWITNIEIAKLSQA